MKPRYLFAIALLATGVGGYLLVEHSVADREIWIAMGAWLLGFWFASGINGIRSPDVDESELEEGDEEADEDWEEEEEEG